MASVQSSECTYGAATPALQLQGIVAKHADSCVPIWAAICRAPLEGISSPSIARAAPLSSGHFSEHQELEKRLLRVQPVLGLLPHYALRAIDHLGRDLLAAVRRQAVHEERIAFRRLHHLPVDLPILE